MKATRQYAYDKQQAATVLGGDPPALMQGDRAGTVARREKGSI